MGKQLWCVAFVAILAAVAGPALAQGDDPNLEGYWKFDGDALDSSGNGRHGTLMGDATFLDVGLWGQALTLDGSGDYVNIDGYKGINAIDGVQQPFSVANWFRITATSGDHEMVTWGTSAGRQRLTWRVHEGRLRTEHASGNLRGNTYVNDGEWHHGALVVTEGANLRVPATRLFVDGVEDTVFSGSDNPYELTPGADVRIGMSGPQNGRYWPGDLDEVYIYSRVLTDDEVAALAMRPKSFQGVPATGSIIEAAQATLEWTPGGFAAEHDVYFGTNPTPGADELIGRQAAATYTAMNLVQEETYYWRIDDVAADGTVYTGDTWSFWVAPQRAYDPQPTDGLINVLLSSQLEWTAGWSPLMHGVYFGTDADTVANAAGAFPQMDLGFDPGPLEPDTTYYWRVDEFYFGQWVASPVWSFTTVPVIEPTTEPNLVAWYTLDEGAGRTALDQSGNGGHGVFSGDVQWADGVEGGALAFDGSGGDYVEAPDAANVTGTHSRTVAAWIKTADYGEIASWGQDVGGQKWIFRVQESNGTLGAIRVEVNGGYQVGSIDVRDNEWHHAAAVLVDDGSPDVNEIALYVDGFLETNSAQLDEPINTAAGVVRIGQSPWGSRPFAGLIDDVRIYDKAFTEEEMRQTFANVNMAWNPEPANAVAVAPWDVAALTWQTGDGAVAHYVYLGMNEAAVANADTSDTTGVFRNIHPTTMYVPPEGLELARTYYWRVDELGLDGQTTKGAVWSFSTTDGLMLDSATTTLDYDNTVEPFISEALWEGPLDLMKGGLPDLSLEIKGIPQAFVEADGVITLSGAGNDIWNNSDAFRFAFVELSGDATIVAQVLSNGTGSNNWTKGGVMVRQSLDADAANVMGAITGGDGNGGTFQWRQIAGEGSGSSRTLTGIAPPYWVRLVREGNTFTVSMSADGVEWAQEGETPIDVNMVDPVLIGLAVTSHQDGEVRAFEFSDVTINGEAVAGLEVADVGVDNGGNDPAPMYVAVEDSAGNSALVTHPNPAATTIADWTEWRVSVADLAAAGVDLTDVATLAVGVGDGTADGVGTVQIRNVQLVRGLPLYSEGFEDYEAGTDLQGVAGWKGWGNAAGAAAPVSDAYAASGSNSVEVLDSSDLVQEFAFAGGTLDFSVMQYIPSGTTGTTYFLLLNTYNDDGPNDWSIQMAFNLEAGIVTSDLGGGATANIIYDRWVEIRCVIDLDNNTVDEYYDGALLSAHQWDDTGNATLGCIDLYGNGASSIYYDDITIR